MNPLDLQRSLRNEVKKMFDGVSFRYKEKEVNLNVYGNHTPKVKRGEDQDAIYPYVQVVLDNGSSNPDQRSVMIIFMVGVYDNDPKNEGELQVFNVLDKLYQRFTADCLLDGTYRYDDEQGMKWQMDDQDTYPYFFGGMTMHFVIPNLRRENKFT